MAGVRQWCAENNLAAYAAGLLDAGFDALEDVAEMEQEEFQACGIRKAGHLKRALRRKQRQS